MARTSVWRSLVPAMVGLLLAAACRETIVAPGECPSLCPSQDVDIRDIELTGIVERDSSYRGYVAAAEAAVSRLSSLPADSAAAVVRFFPRPNFWFRGSSLTDTVFLASVDSVTLSLRVVERDTAVDSVRILVYRAPRPRAIDTLATWDSLTAWVNDSLLVDSIPIPDSLLAGSFTHRLPAGAFEPDSADSNIVGAVLLLRAPVPTVMTIAASGATNAPQLAWYGRAADTTLKNTFTAATEFDTFVQNPEPAPMLADRLYVGNIPAARALLRFNIPRYFIDSTTIVRAVLTLSLVDSVRGAPSGVFALEGRGIVRDFGGKSFFTPSASLATAATLSVGDTAAVELSMTSILRAWRGIPPDSLPRTIILRVTDEGRTLGEVAFAPSSAGARAPRLRLSYIRPYVFGVP